MGTNYLQIKNKQNKDRPTISRWYMSETSIVQRKFSQLLWVEDEGPGGIGGPRLPSEITK